MVHTLTITGAGRSTDEANEIQVVVTGRLTDDDISAIEDKLTAMIGTFGKGVRYTFSTDLRPMPVLGDPSSATPRRVRVSYWEFLSKADVELVGSVLADTFCGESAEDA